MRRFFACFFLICSLFATHAIASVEKWMPEPETESVAKCGKMTRIMKYGKLIENKKSGQPVDYEMTMTTELLGRIEKAQVKPWSRYTLLYPEWSTGFNRREAHIISGNLQEATLIVGRIYEGIIAQKNMTPGRASQLKWKVTVKINALQKVQFNNETFLAYNFGLTNTEISGTKFTLQAEMTYIPQLREFFTAKVKTPKETIQCQLISIKKITEKTKSPL